jgi:hypothetical protein
MLSVSGVSTTSGQQGLQQGTDYIEVHVGYVVKNHGYFLTPEAIDKMLAEREYLLDMNAALRAEVATKDDLIGWLQAQVDELRADLVSQKVEKWVHRLGFFTCLGITGYVAVKEAR